MTDRTECRIQYFGERGNPKRHTRNTKLLPRGYLRVIVIRPKEPMSRRRRVTEESPDKKLESSLLLIFLGIPHIVFFSTRKKSPFGMTFQSGFSVVKEQVISNAH